MSLKKYKKSLSKKLGGDRFCGTVIVVMAIVVIAGLMYTPPADPATNTTIYNFIDVVVTEPPPEGTWYKFKVMFEWTGLVLPEDKRDITFTISTTDLVGIDDYMFDSLDVNNWYTFDGYQFEGGYGLNLAMMSMWPIPPDYETLNDYNLITAAPLAGSIPFYRSDHHAQAAGHIMWEWIII